MRKWLINIYNELVVKAEQSQYLKECHVDLWSTCCNGGKVLF